MCDCHEPSGQGGANGAKVCEVDYYELPLALCECLHGAFRATSFEK